MIRSEFEVIDDYFGTKISDFVRLPYIIEGSPESIEKADDLKSKRA